MTRLYLAGPITGCTRAGAQSWRDEFVERVKGTGIQCFSPLRGTDHLHLLDEVWKGNFEQDVVKCAQAIMTRDRFDCTRADIVVANLLREYMPADAKISLGTAIEIGWADLSRIPIIAIMDRENSPYDHPMLNQAIGFRVQTIREAADLAKVILMPLIPTDQLRFNAFVALRTGYLNRVAKDRAELAELVESSSETNRVPKPLVLPAVLVRDGS